MALAALLTACATQTPPQLEAGIKTVAVVSLMPERVSISTLRGRPFFTPEYSFIDMHGQIERTIWETTANKLAVSRPGWTVKRVAYNPAALLKAYRAGDESALGQFAAQNGLDAIILYTEAFYESMGGQGVGIAQETLPIQRPQLTLVMGNVAAALVDRNGKVAAFSVNRWGTEQWRSATTITEMPLDARTQETFVSELRRLIAVNTSIRMKDLGY
ncbi:hypothetical protein GCM10027034_02150 [Ramlibacter solisilvae]|uniref:Uncharacterized protein n=1 Tax=Ramlibacter tataouinensis TaxID=94132 RepID=A0A127JNU9_9BURK|nr:hypothetical protein UC35_00835 [Ramlibacter tataouinensis]